MPEVVKRIGKTPINLVFIVGENDDGTRYAWLDEVRIDGHGPIRVWGAKATQDGWVRQSTEEMKWLNDLDAVYADEVAASDAAREAIERERLDLRREDAERYAEDRR